MAEPVEPVRVKIRGRELTTWETVEISRGIFRGCGQFGLRYAEADRRQVPFFPGDAVEIWWGRSQRMLVGYVDNLDHVLESDDHSITLSGRDSSADLVDCSVDPQGPQEFTKIDLADLANLLTAPFDVPVNVEGDSGEVFDQFTLEPSESVWSAIERGARIKGLLVYSPGDGTLLITTPGRRRAGQPLREGVNVLSAHLRLRHGERFSDYHVLDAQPGSDDLFGAAAASVIRSSEDAGVFRHRPLVIPAEDSMTPAGATSRAQWEATVRAARATRLEVVVAGWDKFRSGKEPGQLWRVNELVRVDIPTLEIATDMLVEEISYSRSFAPHGGTRATLALVRKDAYVPAPVIEIEAAEEGER